MARLRAAAAAAVLLLIVGAVPVALLLYVPLFVLAFGFALALAALQVFVRDLAQVIGQALMLMMFLSPVFYTRANLPADWQGALDLNPFTFYAESFRSLLLGYGDFDLHRLLVACAIALVALAAGHWLFRRLDPHFEDFL